MLNLQIGRRIGIRGKLAILTRQGASGYAVHSNNDQYPAGRFCALFDVSLHGSPLRAAETVVAQVEVISVVARKIIAYARVTSGELRGATGPVRVFFELNEPRIVMFRVHVTGEAAVIVGGYPHAVPVQGSEVEIEAQIGAVQFPDPTRPGAPRFLSEHGVTLRQLHDRGSLVSVENDAVVISLGKTKIHAREIDDLTFIGELYFRNTYNFVFAKPTCVIDVGMNIGLATLFFAAKENVREVHGYEPFPKTFERALANIKLNSAYAGKIHANNFGLADKNGEVIVTVPAGQLSGMNSTRSAGRGISIPIEIRDASETFRPIVEKARQSGLSVLAKIDCEGSEFAVFESLESRGLLGQISGFMVEWHRGAAERTQHDLLEPLLRRGFMAFDVSRNDRSAGNGFFYAVRSVL